MPNPSSRQCLRVFPTPIESDVLFYDLVEISRECPPGEDIPDYGTPHDDTAVFPSHKFVLAETHDDEGLWQRWWYAKDRSDQEDYNYSLTYPYGGDTDYPQIVREYIVLRGQDPLDLGSEDPGNPFSGASYYYRPDGTSRYLQPSPSQFYYARPALDAGTSGAVLVGQSEEPLGIDSKISSLYVKVTRVYQVIPGSDDPVAGSGSGQTDNGYTIERPMGGDSFLRLTWKLVLPRTVADSHIQTNYTACPIPTFESLVLVDEKITASDENNQISNVVRVYEGNVEGLAFPSTEYTEYKGKFYPGNMPPEKFIVSYRKVVDTYQADAGLFQNVSQPSLAPGEPGVNPTREIDLQSVESKPLNGSSLRSEKSVEYYTDLVLQTLSGSRWDNKIRDNVPWTAQAMTVEQVAELAAPLQGTERTITPYNSGWSVVTIESPVETSLEVLTNPFDVGSSARSYLTDIPSHWPPVLREIVVGVTPDGDRLYYDYTFKEAWNGLTHACIQVAWSKTPPPYTTLDVVQNMDTTSLTLNWPGVISMHIPECLHYNPDAPVGVPSGTYVFSFTGTSYYKAWPPTTYPDWPSELVKELTVTPYLGGYALEKVTVRKPY